MRDIAGGRPLPLTADWRNPRGQIEPIRLPDGRNIIFTNPRGDVEHGPGRWKIPRLGGQATRLDSVDLAALRLTTGLEAFSISLSADGTTAAYDRFILRRNIYALPIPRSGSVSISQARPITTGNQIIESVGLSADNRFLAFSSNLRGDQDIYVMPAAGGEPRRVTSDPGDEVNPAFSPDGREIAFSVTRNANQDIYLINNDGTGERRLTSDSENSGYPAFSPDGLRIAYSNTGPARLTIDVMRRDDLDAPWQAPEHLPIEYGQVPRWSPDGTALVCEDARPVYFLNQGAGALWIYPLGGAVRTAFAGGTGNVWVPKQPAWSADGTRIYFRAFDDDGTEGLYEISVNGGLPRHLVRFDDPSKPVFEGSVVAGNGLFYSVVSEMESDVYVMDLARR